MIDKVVKLTNTQQANLACIVCAKPAEYREDYQFGGHHCFCRIHVVKGASFQPFDRERLPVELR